MGMDSYNYIQGDYYYRGLLMFQITPLTPRREYLNLWCPDDATYKAPAKLIIMDGKLYTSNNGTYKEYV